MVNQSPRLVPLDGYYNRPSDDLWWAIFKRDNPRVDYEQNQVRVSQMVENPDNDPKRNTRGKLVAIPGMGREGEDWLTWNRPFMEDLFKGKDVWVQPKGQTTISEVVEQFNQIWKFQLSPRDYYDQNIEVLHTPMEVKVQMRDTCLCFQGVLTINIGNPHVHIGEVIINRDLSGVEYPTKQSKKMQGPFYVWDRDFTFAGSQLRDEFGYDDIISADQFDILADLFPEEWQMVNQTADWNMQEARVVYNGKTADCPAPCNQKYQRVLLIEMSEVLSGNIAGHINLHYDVLDGA
ncbi:virion structural protein [Salmonella phage SPLA10]|nr:virion structural protein [Salmonella phage SPLA10]